MESDKHYFVHRVKAVFDALRDGWEYRDSYRNVRLTQFSRIVPEGVLREGKLNLEVSLTDCQTMSLHGEVSEKMLGAGKRLAAERFRRTFSTPSDPVTLGQSST